MTSPPEKQNEIIIKPIIYGSVAFYLGRKGKEDSSHKWCVYVRGVNNEDISTFIKEVHFVLHNTFQNHIRKVTKWPFELYEVGWGEFDIKIKIFLIDETAKPLEVFHLLKLYPSQSHIAPSSKRPIVSENYEEIIFVNPKPHIRARLLDTKDETMNNEDINSNSNRVTVVNDSGVEKEGQIQQPNEDGMEIDEVVKKDDNANSNSNNNNNGSCNGGNTDDGVKGMDIDSGNGSNVKMNNGVNENDVNGNNNNITNRNTNAFIPNVSSYFLPMDDSAVVRELEEKNAFVIKEIENIKLAIIEKDKEIAAILKSIKDLK
jgi:YEATS domain-containing protein 4